MSSGRLSVGRSIRSFRKAVGVEVGGVEVSGERFEVGGRFRKRSRKLLSKEEAKSRVASPHQPISRVQPKDHHSQGPSSIYRG